MKLSTKIILFIVGFSALFYWLRAPGHYNIGLVLADLGGIPWLYSSLVTLFSIIVGFTIQKEWENWNNLIDSVKGEVDSLNKLWIWSRHLPKKYKDKFGKAIKYYLTEMTQDGLHKSERGERSENIELAFATLQDAMFEMSQENSPLMATTFAFFSKLIEVRSSRIRYSSHHMPETLRNSLPTASFLIIFLSFFIGVKSIWLDYIFTLSIALAVYIIHLITDDLDNPLKPGAWHLTTIDYQRLLNRINRHSS